MRTNFLAILIFIILFAPSLLLSHGVDIMMIDGGTGVKVMYDSGDPISQADVIVYSPDGEPFQSGLTDKNGCFLFFPDIDGEWKIKINDGMGHGGIRSILMKNLKVVNRNEDYDLPGRRVKILSGISVIFGLTGILFFVLTIRERKRGRDAHS